MGLSRARDPRPSGSAKPEPLQLYYKPVPPSSEEIRLKHRIDELYTQHSFMGYRTIAAIMNREGDYIHKNTVRRYMREMGLMAIYPGPNLSKRDLQHRTYPYLLRAG